jgi:hypothetical protein
MANLKLIAKENINDTEVINIFGALVQMEDMLTRVTIMRNGGRQVSTPRDSTQRNDLYALDSTTGAAANGQEHRNSADEAENWRQTVA